MNLRISSILAVLLLGTAAHAANVNITTKYGKTGGIMGPLNTTNDKINGRSICTDATTPGCDFENDPKYNNNGTVEDPSDDSYSGDLRVRTNDYFEAIAGWTWNNTDGDGEEKVTITGTLPLKDDVAYYEWANLPGFCDASSSSLSEDKQTVVCVRKDFDIHSADTYSEDLPFQVRVMGGAPNGTQPGDIKFKIESLNADLKEDTTDGNTLTITGSPKWNIYAAHYPYFYVATDPDSGEKGYYVTLKFRVGPDEVTGEEDNVNPAIGNESMGKDATFQFTDTLDKMPPNAKLLYCSMKGRTYTQDSAKDDGFIGYDEPITYFGEGSIHNASQYIDSHILSAPDEQTITCSQTGNEIAVKIEHVDATLNHYPTKNYLGKALPKSRALASIATIHFFVPYSDIRKGNDNTDGTADDYRYAVQHHVTGFNPQSPSSNANFNGDGESEMDNTSNFTLPYPGGWSHGWRGKEKPNSTTGYIFQYPGGTWVSGDGVVSAGEEISTYSALSGRDYNDYQTCDIIDAYRAEVVPIKDNKRYINIGTRFVSDLNAPATIGITNDTADYTDGLADDGSGSHDFASLPYTVEYAAGYVNDSFLPSKGGDTTVSHESDVQRECTDASVTWYSDFETARAKSPLGVTKVRFKLKSRKTIPVGTGTYFWVNTHIREKDLVTNAQIEGKDLIVTYGSRKIDDGAWVYSKYIPNDFDTTHTNQGQGDRVAYTGPKARIAKAENKSATSFGDEIIYTLTPSYTLGVTTPYTGDIVVTDMLPKDFKYKDGSTVSTDKSIGEPTIGNCSDISDLDSSCDDSINQVLVWDLGTRTANEEIADINYTVAVGDFAKIGVSFNKVKIESDSDISSIGKRNATVGVNIAVPSALDIVKYTEENSDYPSKRERTATFKDINFVMDIRNNKDGDISDLDSIDLLPFKGDSEKVIKFNDIVVKRTTATQYHGVLKFKSASFAQHPQSQTVCDATNIKYYYTNEDPTKVNMAPTVSDENKLDNAKSIWCEGDATGPNGCTITSKSFTFTDNSEVTAVRVRGATMQKQATCQFKVNVSVKDNLEGDNYTNSTGASATGITLPVLSNSKAVTIVGSSLGDYVWYDKNADGIQDSDEVGMSGVSVKLLDEAGNPIKNPATPSEDYVVVTDAKGKYSFDLLSSGNYIVEFVKPAGFLVSDSGKGNAATDSNIVDKTTLRTGVIALGKDVKEVDIDAGFYAPTILGNIFNDGNHDGTVNGTKINTADGKPLYVTLLDSNNIVLASKAVLADGSYSFNGDDNVSGDANYTVVLSTVANATSSTLPDGWNWADGEHIGTSKGLDAEADGKLAVVVLEVDVPEVNFGINKKPVAQNVSEALQFNPGADKQVNVPDINVSDKEDGTPTTVKIVSLPTNAKLYYNGVAVTEGQEIPNFDNSLLKVDPDAGALTVNITYSTIDKAGVASDNATITMPFKDLKISGKLFIDGNGNGNIDGAPIGTVAGTQMYVTLVKDGKAVASVPLSASGDYEFGIDDGVAVNTSYSVVLSDTNGRTEASLPEKWSHEDGEMIGLTGTDGINDGVLLVPVATTDVVNANFGINKQPAAGDITAPRQLNPGKDTTVNVPNLNVSDEQTQNGLTVTITVLPTNGTLYYSGEAVTAGESIENFDNSLLILDPNDGEITVTFNYTTTDQAGVVSEEAMVTMPFSEVHIDTDGDGIPNNLDLDDDNDGILDTVENSTALNGGDTDGDGIPDSLDLDSDGDGILDLEESNPDFKTVDKDGNGVLDSTKDEDKDGVMDTADADDNNPTSNGSVTPVDTDKDGKPDFQDVDSDNDGLSDLVEGGTDATLDTNRDGILDNQEDHDNDGIADVVDSDNGDKPAGKPASTPDTDNDGIDNYRDLDSDGDSILDVNEIGAKDTDGNGHIAPDGTLVLGTNLPDENHNGIPDVLDGKLKDDIKSATPGEVVTINLLENDEGDIDKDSVQLVIPAALEGSATLSNDGKKMIVEGEGEWSVNENGVLTFTPKDGFEGTPTPIKYSASGNDGKKSTANVTIVLADVSGTSETCDCEDSVPALNWLGLFLMFLLSSIVGMRIIDKED